MTKASPILSPLGGNGRVFPGTAKGEGYAKAEAFSTLLSAYMDSRKGAVGLSTTPSGGEGASVGDSEEGEGTASFRALLFLPSLEGSLPGDASEEGGLSSASESSDGSFPIPWDLSPDAASPVEEEISEIRSS